ncbi:hypothetical protein A3B51_00535 [Candidatus Curtissbacteria bacterium RIFCSPLOWO2_01_FULL_41_18]|uniref:SpoVT-AbrB domain-containing protein n=2 Tax=Candidatus Curtissiibacteriota TaxID=1752717 RepID=A0A1F5G0D4_9BACT|nr:MAG: hypothetical protein A2696_02500 [Candidatus Curtissbacteria bacterium RIFCSPHIGHO2_01_FULL_41_13]OGE04953.1 MAG: hypothetical protein A3B51_00535 [Candidatus Curtissbacteria bacterium RIFCSPLOWO2_01_FULL_41_18]
MYTVTITSQGQITIPVKVRRQLNLDKSKIATVRVEDNKAIIEPVVDIMSLAGTLHKYAKKNMPIDKIIALEKKAAQEAAVERYKRFLKNSSAKLLVIKPRKRTLK